jgi:hypothetical protein
LSPKTLTHEDVHLSFHEHHHFTIVNERDIGGGDGLDEAIDGKSGDGRPLGRSHFQVGNQQPLVFSRSFPREKLVKLLVVIDL